MIKRRIYQVFMVLVMTVSCGLWVYHIAIYRQASEPATKKTETTVESVHSFWVLNSILNRYPLLYRSFLEYRYEEQKGTYIIPGLNAASSIQAGVPDVCTNMVPQSVCVAEDYLLIGSYCHTGKHYSVIYVLNKNSHKYIKTIVLPGRHHVGGIAYDSEHKMVWVSCFNERAQANAFSLKHLEWYNYDIYPHPIRFDYETDIYTVPKGSLMAYYNGYLYIGYFQVNDDSIIQKFKIADDGSLLKVNSARYQQSYGGTLPLTMAVPVNVAIVSSKIQGLAFHNHKMYITQSYGIGNSRLRVFHMKPDSQHDQIYRDENAINDIRLPQKLEQIMIDGEDMYSIYESASYSYRFYSKPTIDRVIQMKIRTVDSMGKRNTK